VCVCVCVCACALLTPVSMYYFGALCGLSPPSCPRASVHASSVLQCVQLCCYVLRASTHFPSGHSGRRLCASMQTRSGKLASIETLGCMGMPISRDDGFAPQRYLCTYAVSKSSTFQTACFKLHVLNRLFDSTHASSVPTGTRAHSHPCIHTHKCSHSHPSRLPEKGHRADPLMPLCPQSLPPL